MFAFSGMTSSGMKARSGENYLNIPRGSRCGCSLSAVPTAAFVLAAAAASVAEAFFKSLSAVAAANSAASFLAYRAASILVSSAFSSASIFCCLASASWVFSNEIAASYYLATSFAITFSASCLPSLLIWSASLTIFDRAFASSLLSLSPIDVMIDKAFSASCYLCSLRAALMLSGKIS